MSKRNSPSLPPGYVKLVERMIELIEQWCGEQPGLPDLRWHDWGDTMFAGALHGEALKYLAASPDAIRLLEWLDAKTNREGTLIQARFALQQLGHFGPKPETVSTSKSFQRIEAFAHGKGEHRVPPSPCGHCGRMNELATGAEGESPTPGAYGICALCGGINTYDTQLRLVRVTDEQVEALPEEGRAELREMQALLRNARLNYQKKRGPGVQA